MRVKLSSDFITLVLNQNLSVLMESLATSHESCTLLTYRYHNREIWIAVKKMYSYNGSFCSEQAIGSQQDLGCEMLE